ncbi:MAG: hypothetical protein NTY38_20010, partial [Acidobacteria bacterium]|nr:hypothetical protein [Acidobacteriota bacterium]
MKSCQALLLLLTSLTVCNAQTGNDLVRDGKARATIVIDEQAGPFYRFVANELSRYIGAISGARPAVVSTTEFRAGSAPLAILVGGPSANRLVREAAGNTIRFDNLKPDGFLLWKTRW